MFVFRPQQALTHAPSCGAGSSRAPYHASRQAAKNQRRTQPKPRRPQALQRRRHLLRDLFAAGQVGHQLSLTSTESLGSRESTGGRCVDHFLDAGSDRMQGSRSKGGGARVRLCARLLQRSCAQLEVTLKQRHGDMWPEHVLQGDFHVMEGMRRICESFALRPELERQVLKATADRAQGILKRRAEAQSGDPPRAAHCPASKTAEGECSRDADSDGSTLTGNTGIVPCQLSAVDSDQAVSSVSDDASVAGTLDGASSDTASADESLTIAIEIARIRTSMSLEGVAAEEPMDLGVVGSSSGGSSSECEAGGLPPWKVSWRSRVLRVLGLQRLWPREGFPTQPATTPVQQQESESVEDAQDSTVSFTLPTRRCEGDEEEDDEEEEESALSSKLVAAVRNAELHAASARAEKVLRSGDDSPTSPATTASPTCSSRSAGSSGSGSSVSFAKNSEVSFFSCHHEVVMSREIAPTLLEYRRALHTKVFDGPSGHKAKRTPSSEKKRSPFEDMDEDALSPDDDEEDEWEDHCDDIAELMSQQRSGLLWSQSW